MPVNMSLTPVIPPVNLKFGQEVKTQFKNNLESLDIQLIDYPTREQAQKIAWNMTKSTWADTPELVDFKDVDPKEASLNLQDVLNYRAIPSPMECLGFTFKISGIDVQTVTHLIRYRTASFAAQCTGDRDQRFDNAVVPESIQNSEFYERFQKIVNDAKQLYSDMTDSKTISIMDARVILPKCLETFYIARFNIKDLIAFIKHRQDVQIQPEVDNIMATKMAKLVCEVIPEITTCLDFSKPDIHYVAQFRVKLPDGTFTTRGTNLYLPEPKNDVFEYHPDDTIYGVRREEINGLKSGEEKIFTKMWQQDIDAIEKIKKDFTSEFK